MSGKLWISFLNYVDKEIVKVITTLGNKRWFCHSLNLEVEAHEIIYYTDDLQPYYDGMQGHASDLGE